MFFEGVQKYFEKVEMMWSNFKKRATRADLAVRARQNIQKKSEKNAKKTDKSHFLDRKITP